MKTIKVILIQAFFTLGFLEISSFLLLKNGFIKDIYSGVTEPLHIINQGMIWRTEEEKWGAWHKTNFTDKHQKSCFNVTYKTNNIGARDDVDYSSKIRGNGIIVLGDSFIEGFGVSNAMTLPKRLESITNIFSYNLGSAYDFGPLQYLMIYKKFNYLPHDTVVVGFLPSNDFVDNDLDRSKFFGKRYRPYYNVNESENNYPVHYNDSAIKRSEVGRYSIGDFIKSQAYRSNLVRLYKSAKFIILHGERNKQESSYNSASINQQNAAVDHLLKIYNEAKKNGVERFVVLGIPNIRDFKLFLENGGTRIIQPWEKKLINFSSNYKDFKYVDGFEALSKLPSDKNYKDLFLECDGHWSENGANANASIIADALRKMKK